MLWGSGFVFVLLMEEFGGGFFGVELSCVVVCFVDEGVELVVLEVWDVLVVEDVFYDGDWF